MDKFCINHPDNKALSFCHSCGHFFCKDCLQEGIEFYYCKKESCQQQLQEEKLQKAENSIITNKKSITNQYKFMEKIFILGIIGSILLFIGVFTPIVSIPIMGNINYFNNGKGDGVIILAISILSFILVLFKKYKGLLYTGFGSLAVLIFTFVNFQIKMNEITSQMNSELADNPFKELANTAISSIQLQWGWALLVIGSILIITSSKLKNEKFI